MVIKYVAYTWQGHKVEGVLDVDRVEEARDILQRDDLIPYRVTLVRPLPSVSRLAPYLFRPKPQELIEFTRGISALLRSGIQLRESLIILREQNRSWGMREVIRRIVEDIENGMRFSDSMSRYPTYFSEFYIRMLRFGEATGSMAPAIQQLVENMEKTKAMKDKVKAALVYPVLSLIVAIGVAIILVTFSLPALIGLLEDFGGEMPMITQILINMSDFTKTSRTQLFVGLVVIAGAGVVFFKTSLGARFRDRVLMKVPMVGSVLVQSNLFNFTSIFSTLLQAGIPTVESLRLASQSVSNYVLKQRLDRILTDVTEGGRLGVAFQEHWPNPPILSQAIVTGEASGSLGQSLRGLADYYEQESVKAIAGATELIQPAVIIIVAGLVGFVATAVMSGIYSALSSIE